MIKMKKLAAMLLASAMVLTLAACGSDSSSSTSSDASADAATTESADAADTAATTESTGDVDYSSIKVGLITLHDENSTYDLNFINGMKEAQEALGFELVIKSNVAEDNDCYETACELAEDGCDVIFADSFSHEAYMIQAANEYPDVQFCHATGTRAHTEGLSNYHNAFASIYEGRYLAGIVAGMKLNEMIANGDITEDQAVMGYVGAKPYAEVKSGYTSFYLGAKSVCPTVTMEVIFTNEWYDEALEKEAAQNLISDGCVLISQHADSMGAPTACEDAGVPNVSYNGSTASACPNTFLVSSRVNWEPYFEYMVDCVATGEAIDNDYVGTIESGSVELSELGTACAEGTQEAIDEATAKLLDGSLNVFDCSTFTVNGETKNSYEADVDFDDAYTPDTEVIIDGVFEESTFRSAPYFDLDIDGITLK